MKKVLIYFIVAILVSCGQSDESDWLKSNASEIRSINPTDADYSDLEPLKKAIGNSRVVLLGEQEHGDGSTYLAKSRMVKFLHEEMGFNILAFEADFFGVNKAWSDYVNGNKEYQNVLNQMYVFWSQSQMCENLFQTIEESQDTSNPIILAGFDNQQLTRVSKEELIPALDSIVRFHNVSVSITNMNFFNNTLQEAMDKFHDQELTADDQDRFLRILETVSKEIYNKQIDSFWIQELDNIRGFVLHCWHWWIDRENDMVDNNYRDIQMAKNCLWLLNEKHEAEKLIIWAANGHIVKTDTLYEVETEGWKPEIRQYPMGEILFDSLGEELYSIGFTSYSGMSTSLKYDSEAQDFTFQSYPFEPADSTSFEFELKQIGHQYAFLSLKEESDPWLHEDRRMRVWRPDYIRGKLSDLYDGIFYIEEMNPNAKIE